MEMPASLPGSGNTILNLAGDNASAGTYTLTITATGGGHTNTTRAALTITT
jgi:hypothetical protein